MYEACTQAIEKDSWVKELADHTPETDDGDCTTAINCTECGNVAVEAAEAHVPAEDDGDCTTDVYCKNCQQVVEEGAEAHTGGAATCKAKAVCDVCGKEYGELAAHTEVTDEAVEATCTATGTHRERRRRRHWQGDNRQFCR